MFREPQPPAYLDRLTDATLRTPEWAARALLSYPVPRSYWREAIYSTAKPVLYVVRPGLAAQAENLTAGGRTLRRRCSPMRDTRCSSMIRGDLTR